MAVGYRLQPPPASPQDIERLDRQAGRLPEEYLEFLRRQDGGYLEDNDRALKVIFGLGDVPDALNMWKKLKTFEGRVPAWLLPVAQDEYGNLFCLSLRDEDFGTVWFWDHEEEADEDEPPTEDNVSEIAADWRAFIERLGPIEG